jgi:hypothetical protein
VNRDASAPLVVVGPIKRTAFPAILVVLAAGLALVIAGVASTSPATMTCRRLDAKLVCVRSERGKADRENEVRPSEVRVHAGRPRSCLWLDGVSECGGDANENAEKLRSLQGGASVTLDVGDAGGFPFLALGGLLVLGWGGAAVLAGMLGRRTRFEIAVRADRLDVVRFSWRGRASPAVSLERVAEETVGVKKVVLGRRGAIWCIVYGASGKRQVVADCRGAREADLLPSAVRLREALAARPRSGHDAAQRALDAHSKERPDSVE